MKTILIISFSDLALDPRVNRQIGFLKDKYKVIAVGFGNPDINGIDFIPVFRPPKFQLILTSPKLLFRQYESWYWGQKHVQDCFKTLSNVCIDLFLANNIDTLPLTLKLAKRSQVILDAHEYAPRQAEDLFLWRIFSQNYKTFLCKAYIPQVNSMTTVCQGLADAYQKDTGVKPVIITNAPDFEDIQPRLQPKDTSIIQMVHHGVANPSRKIENMIKMMEYLDERFNLDFIFINTGSSYTQYLKRLARGKSNIRFLPPVPMRTLPKYLNQYDIGLFLLEPTNFNYFHALPNKFFEFIQARLAIAIGPSPEMARLVKDYDLGVVAEDFSPGTLARCLKSLNREKINYYKLQSHRVSRILSSEQNKKILLDLVQQALVDQG
jgi:hypothetical protein